MIERGVNMRRVVVTGMGLLSPLACGVEESWRRALAGKSGAGQIKHFDATHLKATRAGRIRNSNPTVRVEPTMRVIASRCIKGLTS